MSDHRAKKSGLGADIDKKMEARYGEAEQSGTTNAVMLWVNAMTQGEHDPIPSGTQRDMHRGLQNGVMLCKLINKLLASENKKPVSFQNKAASPFVAMGNIESYNKGCLEYGLGKEFLFQSTDLYEGRKGPFLNIINGIHSLGFVANGKNYPVTYTGRQEKYLDNE